MKVLLSIKPEFVEKILDGTKKYEYRKSMFKRKDISTVVIYASYPVKKVVGEFRIKRIISEDVESVWNITSESSGITKVFYDKYFQQKTMANAIEIGELIKYDRPKELADYNIICAPQSFCYIGNWLQIRNKILNDKYQLCIVNIVERAKALYDQDAAMPVRKSHENAAVKAVYDEFFGEPGSHKAHEILHTSYVKRTINK